MKSLEIPSIVLKIDVMNPIVKFCQLTKKIKTNSLTTNSFQMCIAPQSPENEKKNQMIFKIFTSIRNFNLILPINKEESFWKSPKPILSLIKALINLNFRKLQFLKLHSKKYNKKMLKPHPFLNSRRSKVIIKVKS